jgi:cell volume regulation protein A
MWDKGGMEFAHHALLVAGLLAIAAIVAAQLAGRIGTPVLLVFLGLGMLAGEDGPGGIPFDDFAATYLLGSVALAIILFEGGMKTSTSMLRVAGWPALALATLGVAVSAGVLGGAAVWLVGVPWPAGLLLGALVAPTDAAAVASLLRASGLRLPERVLGVLEVESGLNDPMAVFLTVVLVEILGHAAPVAIGSALGLFLWEMLGGVALGLAGGAALLWLGGRMRGEQALLPVMALAGAIACFGVAQSAHASGFLAVYAAGVVVGNRGAALEGVSGAFEGFAWVAQIGLFLMLGLLVTPHDLLPLLAPGCVLAAVSIFVARPLAAMLCLKPFGFSWGETGFVGWVGLRGAVPIFLAIIPVMEGLPNGKLAFAAAFLVVLVSLAVQGWTIGPAARVFRVK